MTISWISVKTHLIVCYKFGNPRSLHESYNGTYFQMLSCTSCFGTGNTSRLFRSGNSGGFIIIDYMLHSCYNYNIILRIQYNSSCIHPGRLIMLTNLNTFDYVLKLALSGSMQDSLHLLNSVT